FPPRRATSPSPRRRSRRHREGAGQWPGVSVAHPRSSSMRRVMSFRIPLLPVLAIVALGPTSALAQTEQEFVEVLTGEWAVHDDVYAVDGGTCRVTLKSSKAAEDYELTTESCNLELGML